MLFLLFLTLLYCRREDSVIVILCRNSDKNQMSKTMQNFEEKFNKNYHYPYVFLNDKEWDEDFKKEMMNQTESEILFETVDSDDWNPPEDLELQRAKNSWEFMSQKGVPYAKELSYHNMCRFYSKSFYQHPALMKYKYYWRLEPGVRYRCLIEKDPFEKMADYGYIYGFTIALVEFKDSIPTLGRTTGNFINEYSDLIPKDINFLNFMFNNGNYNGCHFWSNFEIADFDFFRSEVYTNYVNYLDRAGGFYYERWGDAPVHSLAVALFADKSKIHYFEAIGYTHPPFTHCPKDNSKCDCKPEESLDGRPGTCIDRYLKDRASI